MDHSRQVWPTFAAIISFGFIAKDIYPGSFAMAGVYEAGMQSIGNWCVVIVIALLIFCEVLNETASSAGSPSGS